MLIYNYIVNFNTLSKGITVDIIFPAASRRAEYGHP